MQEKFWQVEQLSNLCFFVRGVSYQKEVTSLTQQKDYIPILRAGNIQSGRIILEDLVFVPRAFVSDQQKLKIGDNVFAMSSGSAHLVGKVATIQQADFSLFKEISFGAFCGVWRSFSLNSMSILKYFWETSNYKNYIRTISAGININNLKSEVIGQLQIPLPPLNEQRRIVAKLEQLQGRIQRVREALEQVPAKLEQLKQSVLAAAFRGDLTAQWRQEHPDVEPASVLLERIRQERRASWIEDRAERQRAKAEAKALAAGQFWSNADNQRILAEARVKVAGKYVNSPCPDISSLPELPQGWVWASVNELTDVLRPVVYGIIKAGDHIDDGVPVVRIKDINGSYLDPSNLKRCHKNKAMEFARSMLQFNDILISKDGTIGKVSLVPKELEGANISQHVLRWSVERNINFLYVFFVLQSKFCQMWMQGEVRGIALQGINVEDFRLMPIPLMSVDEQYEIVNILQKKMQTINLLRENSFVYSYGKIAQLENALLSKAFRGELVPQDPNDEPASVLLERIRAEREANGEQKKGGRGRKKKEAASTVLQAAPASQPPASVPTIQKAVTTEALPPKVENIIQWSLFGEDETQEAAKKAILETLKTRGTLMGKAELVEVLKLSDAQWNQAIQDLLGQGTVLREGQKRGAKYRINI